MANIFFAECIISLKILEFLLQLTTQPEDNSRLTKILVRCILSSEIVRVLFFSLCAKAFLKCFVVCLFVVVRNELLSFPFQLFSTLISGRGVGMLLNPVAGGALRLTAQLGIVAQRRLTQPPSASPLPDPCPVSSEVTSDEQLDVGDVLLYRGNT